MNLNIKITPNQKFGFLFAIIFGVAFTYFQSKHSLVLAILSLILSIFFALSTIFIPSILLPLNRSWLAFSFFLGKVISPIILSIIFFLMIVPVGLIGRLYGRDALLLKKRNVTSYWMDKDIIQPDSFKNQF